MFDGDTIELNGCTYRVSFPMDEQQEPPWEREDGHGPVSDWRRVGYHGYPVKSPGERVLFADRGDYLLYGFREAVRIARRDGWGTSEPDHGDSLKPGERAARAAEEDYQRLRRFCAGDWCYVGVRVQLLDVNGEPVESADSSVWGVESDSEDYLTELAYEVAREIEVPDSDTFTLTREWKIRNATCECSDSQCPVCSGTCSTVGTVSLFRIDMDDRTGTLFCSQCASDALESGLFTNQRRMTL